MKRIVLVPDVIWEQWPRAAVEYGKRELCKQGWEPVLGPAGTPVAKRQGRIDGRTLTT